jgi:hypothetical protein
MRQINGLKDLDLDNGVTPIIPHEFYSKSSYDDFFYEAVTRIVTIIH